MADEFWVLLAAATTLSITILSITMFSIMTLSIKSQLVTLVIKILDRVPLCAESRYAECRGLFIVMLNGIILSHYSQRRYAEFRYAEYHYAECRYSEGRGAKPALA